MLSSVADADARPAAWPTPRRRAPLPDAGTIPAMMELLPGGVTRGRRLTNRP
jgi:hypothetical protein